MTYATGRELEYLYQVIRLQALSCIPFRPADMPQSNRRDETERGDSAPKGVIVGARRVMEEGLTLRCEEDRLLRIGFCVAARWFMLCRRIWIAHLPAARDLFIHQPGYLWQGYYGVVGAGADLLFWRGASLSPVYALNATMSDRFLFCQARVFIPAHASIHPSILSLSRRPTPCRCPL